MMQVSTLTKSADDGWSSTGAAHEHHGLHSSRESEAASVAVPRSAWSIATGTGGHACIGRSRGPWVAWCPHSARGFPRVLSGPEHSTGPRRSATKEEGRQGRGGANASERQHP